MSDPATPVPAPMEAASSEDAPRRKHPRTPLSLLVQYRSNSFEEFLAEYSVNLSPGGIFIRTDEPQEMGAMLYLQFFLKDGSRLIEGLGRVVHVNAPGQPGVPAGMGIEFVNLEEDSREIIEDICKAKAAAEGR